MLFLDISENHDIICADLPPVAEQLACTGVMVSLVPHMAKHKSLRPYELQIGGLSNSHCLKVPPCQYLNATRNLAAHDSLHFGTNAGHNRRGFGLQLVGLNIRHVVHVLYANPVLQQINPFSLKSTPLRTCASQFCTSCKLRRRNRLSPAV